jgi:hypothetical protein
MLSIYFKKAAFRGEKTILFTSHVQSEMYKLSWREKNTINQTCCVDYVYLKSLFYPLISALPKACFTKFATLILAQNRFQKKRRTR